MKNVRSTAVLKLVFLLGLFVSSAAAYGHHSASGFAMDRVVRLEGTVTQFRWTNPHATIKINGVAGNHGLEAWTIELTAPNALMNQGWKRTSLKSGDRVVIYAHPMLDETFRLDDGSIGAYYSGVILADGETLGEIPAH